MKTFRILGVAALAGLALVPDALAQRRGGAVSSGMRGAVVGGMVGGSSGAQTGAKVGAVTGAARGVADRSADRNAVYAENQARAQYQNTTAYQSAPHSNFNEAPPAVIVAPATTPSTTTAFPSRKRRRCHRRPPLPHPPSAAGASRATRAAADSPRAAPQWTESRRAPVRSAALPYVRGR